MMTLRTTTIAFTGLLTLGLGPIAAAQPAPVPAPGAPITPQSAPQVAPAGTLAPEDAAPVVQPPVAAPEPPIETLPSTPAPTPYGTAAPAAPAAPAEPAPGPVAMDYGGEMMTPLPPPPPPLDPSTISRGPWRGRGWLALRLSVTGPVGGDLGARPSVLSFGGGGDLGWRINNVVGLGMGVSGQIHSRIRVREVGTNDTTRFNNGLLYWDAAFLRLYLPLKRRFQPYAEVGGGLARLNHHAPDATGAVVPLRSYGGQVRAALGFEAWITSTFTFGFSGTYRLNAFRDLPGQGAGWSVGHAMQGVIDFAAHW